VLRVTNYYFENFFPEETDMNRYGFIQRITITPDMKDPVSGQRVFFEFLVTDLPNRQSVKGGGIHT
jgi:hypothetical protein